MSERLQIFLEDLRGGEELDIDITLNPDKDTLEEPDFCFRAALNVQGRAYLADNELIVHYSLQTEALLPCKICNEWVTVPIELNDLIEVRSVKKIKNRVADLTETVRQQAMLEVPLIVECHQGSCPARKELNKYLK